MTFDELADALTELTSARPGPDGQHTWHPMLLSTTLTIADHRDDVAVLAHVEALLDEDAHELGRRGDDLITIQLAASTSYVPRKHFRDARIVDLHERNARTISIELRPELTLDVTVVYDYAD